MAKKSGRFPRVVEVFFGSGHESSGSEQAAESLTDLSDLVNSFLESDEIEEIDSCEGERTNESGFDSSERLCGDPKIKNMLKGFLENKEKSDVEEKIRVEVDVACRGIDEKSSSTEFKRRLMISLRERGFDAGR